MIIYARNSSVKSKTGANVLKNLKRKMSTVDTKYNSTKKQKITNYSEYAYREAIDVIKWHKYALKSNYSNGAMIAQLREELK